jgi:hypothetical protein
MHVAPGEDNLERGMEGGQGHVAAEEEATPDQRADPLHHDPELIDMWGGSPRQDILIVSQSPFES